ncbi:tetratricopeptide repeat protein [Streptomyces sp. NBC_00094]|uniref:tetratricopeptide repeat protein n=1 Tax=Streptomyces sp. NBC_00094 TaxID=2903620 RepID=UPI00225640C8|nr:tetratricopeptide repeat protein [Streptomyces sp. NBC_00094]MCX5391146.1 sel1 repeat family protein [Streptomyces sp. NBC_00094]
MHLDEGRRAAEAGDWVAAGHAFVRAAMEGSAEGAELATQVTVGLVPLADAGSAEAAALLAGIYLEYFDESALPDAVRYARAAAGAGLPAGERTYGYMLLEGIGVEEDHARAAELFRTAAEAGDAYACLNLAQLVDDPDESRRLLEEAARAGVDVAGVLLADELSSLDRDEEALTWYLWAAERGHTGAMNAAACWYRDGFGTDPDPVQAVRWFFVMSAYGDGDGVHEAIELAKSGGVDENQVREAGRLANDPAAAEALIATVWGG